MKRELFDAIVIGGGGSGLAAAVAVAESGLGALVLEKRPRPGGTTAIAVGSFTAAGTAFQQRAGIADDPDRHAEDAGKFAPAELEARNHPALRRFFLKHAAATLDWLAGMGIEFRGPAPEPPNRAARMHNALPGGRAFIDALEGRLRALGGRTLCGAAAEELIIERGRVAGVVARVEGERRDCRAARGVVLAAGDYSSAPDLIARHRGEAFARIEGVNPHASGDGQRLAESAGAHLINMDVAYGPELRFPPPAALEKAVAEDAALAPGPPPAWLHPEDRLFEDGAILVNSCGERFCDERRSPQRELAAAAQPGKRCWILLDRRLSEMYRARPRYISTAPGIAYAAVEDYLRDRPDLAIEAGSLDELASRSGLPPAGLRAAAAPSEPGRWVLLGPARPYFTTTEGGAAVNERLQALDAAGRPIPGLLAAGQNGLGGQILWGHGLHLAWALTSGRLAGRSLSRS